MPTSTLRKVNMGTYRALVLGKLAWVVTVGSHAIRNI